MSNFTVTPNMGLVLPIPGQDPGPDYGNNQYSSGLILDGHNHSPGSGVVINPNGLDINADLPINGNNLTQVKTINFEAQIASLAGLAPNLGCIYVAGNELVYNDEVGNVVPITNNGSVNAGAGSITGLPSGTASATYNAGSLTFIWQSSTSTPANMDGGSFIFRNLTANSKGVTVSAPAALAADYGIVWPPLPVATSVVIIDNSGNMGTQTYNQVGQNMTSVGANAIANSRTRTLGNPVSVGGFALSASSGSFSSGSGSDVKITNMSVTITTSGRPVKIGFVADGIATAIIGITSGTSVSDTTFTIWNGLVSIGTVISNATLSMEAVGSGPIEMFYHPDSFGTVDTTVSGTPGTYTYEASVRANSGSFGGSNIKMYAYEL